jgi:hypothetical protein
MTTEIESKIINQPSILHILVAFWVLFSHNNVQRSLHKTLIVQRNVDQEFFKYFSLTCRNLLNTVQLI